MRVTSPSAMGVLYLNFNQDYTCISIADFKGIKIYSLDTYRICYSSEMGAVRSETTCLLVPSLLLSSLCILCILTGLIVVFVNFCLLAARSYVQADPCCVVNIVIPD
jgi:hypothetical protein